MNKRKWMILLGVVVLIGAAYFLLSQMKFDSEAFGITDYKSQIDYDHDGLDDQSDILQGVKDYVKTEPEYKSVYYDGGYPTDGYGVCTDVVANGLLAAGYDLKELVNEHILANRDMYEIEVVDSNIDFRRVRNLYVYFKDTAIELTTDLSKIEEWHAGDIVVFEGHIGVISDKRNFKGIPYVIHHGSVDQPAYEQDILERNRAKIIGHFRIN